MKSPDKSKEEILMTIQLLEEITKSKNMMYFDIGFITLPLIFIL